MNREPLFKAKRKDNGEWVEGYYVKTTIGNDVTPSDVIFVPFKVSRNEKRGWIKIDPDTLCQYTGLTDKNGKKIWENDVVRTNQYGVDSGDGRNFSGFDAFSINFSDGSFCLMNKWRRFNLRPSTQLKIIGNIFDGGFNDSKKTKEN